jgi:hypothetical protein
MPPMRMATRPTTWSGKHVTGEDMSTARSVGRRPFLLGSVAALVSATMPRSGWPADTAKISVADFGAVPRIEDAGLALRRLTPCAERFDAAGRDRMSML